MGSSVELSRGTCSYCKDGYVYQMFGDYWGNCEQIIFCTSCGCHTYYEGDYLETRRFTRANGVVLLPENHEGWPQPSGCNPSFSLNGENVCAYPIFENDQLDRMLSALQDGTAAADWLIATRATWFADLILADGSVLANSTTMPVGKVSAPEILFGSPERKWRHLIEGLLPPPNWESRSFRKRRKLLRRQMIASYVYHQSMAQTHDNSPCIAMSQEEEEFLIPF